MSEVKNSQYFSAEDVKTGIFNNFIKLLTESCYDSTDFYNDIHIIPADCGAFVVEWIQVGWEMPKEYSKFITISPEETILYEAVKNYTNEELDKIAYKAKEIFN